MTDEQVASILTDASARMLARPIETERLILRPFSEDDLEDFSEYITQRELQRLSGNPRIETEEEAREAFDRLLEHNREVVTRFAAVLKETGKVVGNFCINIYPFVKEDPSLEDKRGVSISLVLNEKYQRRGLMTELMKRVMRYFLIEEGFDFVNSGYFVFNEGSRKIQERAGMRPYIVHHFEYEGEVIETREMILFREELAAKEKNASVS